MTISVQNLSKKYGDKWAIRDLNFELKKGEIVGFLGPNGAGKSTTMKILAGVISPTEGEVNIQDDKGSDHETASSQHIGYLAEHNPLYTDMYVSEFLRFVGKIYKVNDLKASIEKCIVATGLKTERHKKIGALSKGYRQRVGLAATILHDPPILILDEPISGLDPNQLKEIRNLIKEAGKNKTVLFSSHILQEIEAICDRVIVINQGSIVAQGKLKDLRKASNHGQIVLEIESEKEVDWQVVRALEGISSVDVLTATAAKIVCKKDIDPRTELIKLFTSREWGILELKKIEENTESLFSRLTKE